MKLSRPIVLLLLVVAAYFLLRSMSASGSLSLDFAVARPEPSPFDLVMESRTTADARRIAGSLPGTGTILLLVAGVGATTLLLHFGSGFLRQARLTRNRRRSSNRRQGRGDRQPRVRDVPAAVRHVRQLPDGRQRQPPDERRVHREEQEHVERR